ncbi:2-aminoethylphosphonate ABC transporter permease subunit [Kribbella speibonae]|uniref:2-aminoethylphosphonate ABC transporter permease subunit n=1 Tax=Kribbella speibonae TaxID=1572660 RepID=A0A4R0JBZ3_9ACTN|nr:2-aminoethylphosphonate ABC transporter permease subunit [Kribbella speibonae]TCC18102.1 2-aminoethylphosphonate ABC transporter permease subunit [Kribbella speibonae]TCC42116.1 2-aminoethylphosphonate ABC transporter permease subunit [Kribbella speibonae]
MAVELLGVPAVRESQRRRDGKWLWVLPPLLLIAVLVVYPLVLVAVESAPAWGEVVGSAEFRNALLRTVQIAASSTAGCLVVGTFLAVVISFVPFPGARIVAGLVDTMLALPSFLVALSFTFIYGATGILRAGGFLASPWAVVLAEITFYTPFVLRPLLAAMSRLPRAQLDVAASLGAGPWRVLRQIVLPEVRPALVAGGSLTLLLTLNEFGIVLFLGAKGTTTLPMLVHTKGIVMFDYPGACVIAVVQIALSLGLYAVLRVALGGRRARLD